MAERIKNIQQGLNEVVKDPIAALFKNVLFKGFSLVDPNNLSGEQLALIKDKMAHQFDSISPKYVDSSSGDDYDRRMLINPHTEEAIARTVKPGDIVVDLGAGASPFAETILNRQSAAGLIAVDYSKGLLESGKARLPMEVRDRMTTIEANMTELLDIKDVDVVTSWLAQLYMLDSQFSTVCANVSSILRNGGKFIMSVPNYKVTAGTLGIKDLDEDNSKIVVDLPMSYGKTQLPTTFVVRNHDRYAKLAAAEGLVLSSIDEMRPSEDFLKGGNLMDKMRGKIFQKIPPYVIYGFEKIGR